MSAMDVDVSLANVTSSQSLALVKNMLRISVSSICYHRDIFPKNCFVKRDHGPNQPVVNILQSAEEDTEDGSQDGRVMVVKNQDAFLLTQWLEKGVFSAIEAGFLSSMKFAIFTKHPKTGQDLLLETYDFKLAYPTASDPLQRTMINGAPLTKKALKSQANKFVRSLIEFSETLDDLPEHNWITLELQYVDSCPPDYEPEFFKSAAVGIPSFDGSNKFMRIKIGTITSTHHDLTVKFVGLESLSDASLQMAVCAPTTPRGTSTTPANHGGSSSRQPSAFRGASMGNADGQQLDPTPDIDTINGVGPDPSLLSTSISQLVIASQCCLHTPSDAGSVDNASTVTVSIREYFTTNREASIKDVSKDLQLDEPTVKDELTRMAEAGFLKQLRTRGRYAIQDDVLEEIRGGDKKRTAPSAPRKRTREERQVFEETVEDTIEEFDSDPTSASAALAGASRLGGAGQPKLVLQKGGSRGSSVHAESSAAAPLSRAAAAPAAAEEPISLSQTSDGDNPTKKRKRSLIKDPIHVSRAANKLENEHSDGEVGFKEPFPYSQ